MTFGTLPKSIAAFRETSERKASKLPGITTIRHRCVRCKGYKPAYLSKQIGGQWICLDCIGGDD